MLIDRPVEINPFVPNLDIGLIHSPGGTNRPFSGLGLRSDCRAVTNDPSVQCRVIHIDAALFHDFLQIPVGNAIAYIKEDCEKNHVFRKMGAFETEQRNVPWNIKMKTLLLNETQLEMKGI